MQNTIDPEAGFSLGLTFPGLPLTFSPKYGLNGILELVSLPSHRGIGFLSGPSLQKKLQKNNINKTKIQKVSWGIF